MLFGPHQQNKGKGSNTYKVKQLKPSWYPQHPPHEHMYKTMTAFKGELRKTTVFQFNSILFFHNY